MSLTLRYFLGAVLVVSVNALANDKDPEFYKIVRSTVTEEAPSKLSKNKKLYGRNSFSNVIDSANPIETAGKVISTARDLVALGEDIYKLVIKGKPTNTTSYAPISVVPKNAAGPVDPLEMEHWSFPHARNYVRIFYNVYNYPVVTFRYSVMFSANGSYEGKGQYLTGVQIIPTSINTISGFDFTSTMKLGGIQNISNKTSPVAGATLILEYTISSFMNTQFLTDRFFVTGIGQIKKY